MSAERGAHKEGDPSNGAGAADLHARCHPQQRGGGAVRPGSEVLCQGGPIHTQHRRLPQGRLTGREKVRRLLIRKHLIYTCVVYTYKVAMDDHHVYVHFVLTFTTVPVGRL